mgnify:CR=1 FL=1
MNNAKKNNPVKNLSPYFVLGGIIVVIFWLPFPAVKKPLNDSSIISQSSSKSVSSLHSSYLVTINAVGGSFLCSKRYSLKSDLLYYYIYL